MAKNKDSGRPSRESEKAKIKPGRTTVSRHFKAGSQRSDGSIREQDGYEKTQDTKGK